MKLKSFFYHIVHWFDTHAGVNAEEDFEGVQTKTIAWLRILPFIFMHAACFAVIWVGWSPVAVITAIGLYALRIFVITGFYHRYFSHKTFKTSRVAQFIFALLGGLCVQRGALWWAAHHRNHHRYSDEPQDPHSPKQYGFWWAHMGWITNKSNFPTRLKLVPDLAKYPELMWLNRFDLVVPVLFAVSLYVGGILLQKFFPHLGTSGGQMLVWGFFISTVFLFHATGTINSLAHRWGSRRFETKDTSRNNFWLALLTFGEGWHNNHHEYPATPRQGFYWWEIDLTYYLLKVLEKLGIIWDLKPVPAWVYQKAKLKPVIKNTKSFQAIEADSSAL